MDSTGDDNNWVLWKLWSIMIQQLWDDPRTRVIWTDHILFKKVVRCISYTQIDQSIALGLITTPPRPGDNPGLWKFRLDNFTEGSDNRQIGTVVEVDFEKREIIMITTMWVDEKDTPRGTFS